MLDQGREYKTLKEADDAVRLEMERLALERKNLVNNVKKLDEAMLLLRSVAGTSPAVAAAVSRRLAVTGRSAQERRRRRPAAIARLHRAAGRFACDRLRNNPGEQPAPTPAAGGSRRRPQQPHPANGLSPAQIEASWPPCPSPSASSPACSRFRACRRNGPSANRAITIWKPSTPKTFTKKSTAAPRVSFNTASREWHTPSTTRPVTQSNELQLYVFEMADSLKALGKYGSEKPEEFQTVAVGDAGYTSAGSLLFYAGRYYTQIVSTKDDPKFAAFALDLAKRVASLQKPGGARRTFRRRAPAHLQPRRQPAAAPHPAAHELRPASPAAHQARAEGDLAGDVLRPPAGPGPGRRSQVRRPGRLRL